MKLFVQNLITVAVKQHLSVLIYITPPKNNNNVQKNVNVKRGRCPLTTVGDVTMLARINQVSNGRL